MNNLIDNIITSITNDNLRYRYSKYIDNTLTSSELMYESAIINGNLANNVRPNDRLMNRAESIVEMISSFLISFDTMYKKIQNTLSTIDDIIKNPVLLERYKQSDNTIKCVSIDINMKMILFDSISRLISFKSYHDINMSQIITKYDSYNFNQLYNIFKYPCPYDMDSVNTYKSFIDNNIDLLHDIIDFIISNKSDINESQIKYQDMYKLSSLMTRSAMVNYRSAINLFNMIKKANI